MWEMPGTLFDPTPLGDFKPAEVLLAFDGPRIFTCYDRSSQLLLVYQVAETDDACRYFVVPTNSTTIEGLKAGRLSIREALDSRWGWLVDLGEEWRPLAANSVDGVEALPPTVLPKRTVFLTGSITPLFSVKALGPQLAKDHTPASVVTRTVTQSTRALRRLLTHAIETVGETGRGDTWELLNDPPVSMLAASFEVSYYPPSARSTRLFPEQTKSVLDEIGRLLTTALEWAADPNDERLPATPGKDAAETEVLLQCLADLTPPTTGAVERIEVGGRLVRGGRDIAKLDRSARRLVTATQRFHTPAEVGQYVEKAGVITHVDWMQKRFRLVTEKGGEVFFRYGTDLYDAAEEAYSERYPVSVYGRTGRDSQVVAILITPAPSTPVPPASPTTE